jgi:hypothetical protein
MSKSVKNARTTRAHPLTHFNMKNSSYRLSDLLNDN